MPPQCSNTDVSRAESLAAAAAISQEPQRWRAPKDGPEGRPPAAAPPPPPPAAKGLLGVLGAKQGATGCDASATAAAPAPPPFDAGFDSMPGGGRAAAVTALPLVLCGSELVGVVLVFQTGERAAAPSEDDLTYPGGGRRASVEAAA